LNNSKLQGLWRVDEIKIDTVVIDPADGPHVGSEVELTATNIGAVASYFYATWETEDVQ
jgi:hypothetical protein